MTGVGVRLAAAAFALGSVGFIAGFFLFLSMVPRSGEPAPGQADGIVVLTGGSQRVDGALALLADGHARRLLVSGVYEKTTRAQLAAHNPDAAGLLQCCVDLDYRARNTIGNAIETRRWARAHEFRSIIVVTSNYHMPRALVELRSILHDYELKPYAVVTGSVDPDAWWRSVASARLLLAEYGKYLVALVRTRLERDPEYAPIRLMAGGRKPLFRDVITR
ncbi:YdcF family protein [Camelimonas abortus]|uniref:YdcF family protein n=1 Tax=Camelimonas abortus TaxID=1017184 RepID=A0ABV7LH41_9HYPH